MTPDAPCPLTAELPVPTWPVEGVVTLLLEAGLAATVDAALGTFRLTARACVGLPPGAGVSNFVR